jgi:hypothetical protein
VPTSNPGFQARRETDGRSQIPGLSWPNNQLLLGGEPVSEVLQLRPIPTFDHEATNEWLEVDWAAVSAVKAQVDSKKDVAAVFVECHSIT